MTDATLNILILAYFITLSGKNIPYIHVANICICINITLNNTHTCTHAHTHITHTEHTHNYTLNF